MGGTRCNQCALQHGSKYQWAERWEKYQCVNGNLPARAGHTPACRSCAACGCSSTAAAMRLPSYCCCRRGLLLVPLGQRTHAARPPLLLAHRQSRVGGRGGQQRGAPPGTQHRVVCQVDAQLWVWRGRGKWAVMSKAEGSGARPGHSTYLHRARTCRPTEVRLSLPAVQKTFTPPSSACARCGAPRNHLAPAAAAPQAGAPGSRGTASCRLR